MAPGSIDEEFLENVDALISYLKRNELQVSSDVAVKTVLLLRKLVGNTKWNTAKELLESIKLVGKRVTDAQPSETSITNMVRRVLKIVRDEYITITKKEDTAQSSLLTQKQLAVDFSQSAHGLKSAIIDAMNELLSELETSKDNIAAQALENIHSNEIIMTFGRSRTVEGFLKNAASANRKFSVIVAENAPFYQGQELAKSLAKDGIDTTVITDSAVFAIMARVNKVIIGTHTVMADGGMKALSGSHAVALAAKHHSVPLLVCAGLFKLSPQFVCSYDQDSVNRFLSPNDVIRYSEAGPVSKVLIPNPVYDYIPPDLVNLFISDIGGNSPSYMYRLLSELYDPEDYN